jgi:hypothetical protein
VPLVDPVVLGFLACLYHHVTPLFQAHQVSLVVPRILAGPVEKNMVVLVGVCNKVVRVIQCGFSNVQKYPQHIKICAKGCHFLLKCLAKQQLRVQGQCC